MVPTKAYRYHAVGFEWFRQRFFFATTAAAQSVLMIPAKVYLSHNRCYAAGFDDTGKRFISATTAATQSVLMIWSKPES